MKHISVVFIFIALLAMSCEAEEVGIDIIQENIGRDKEEDFLSAKAVALEPFSAFEDWHNMQGGAIYGDYLVCLMATDELEDEIYNGFIYDIRTGSKVSNLLFPNVIGNRSFYKPHANQVSFGSSYYGSDSAFPLLYVSQVNGGSGYDDIRGERGVLVYDIKRIKGEYVPSLVQAIVPDLNDEKLMKALGDYTPNYIVDSQNNRFIVIGYPFRSWFKLSGPQPVAIFDIPKITDGAECVLKYSDIVEHYQFPVSLGVQQSTIHNGMIYSLCGSAKKGALRIIGIESRQVEKLFNLADITSGEPQFIGFWRNRMLYYEAGTTGVMYEITKAHTIE